MLHHSNAPARMSILIHEFLAKHKMTVISQSPYSPDLAPSSVPKDEIHSEMSPISDNRRDRRKLVTRPTPNPAKRIPGFVADLKKH
jgi:hypothetical protein